MVTQLRIALVCAAVLAAVAAYGQPLQLEGDWWKAPAAATRQTTLVCSFDKGDDADAAREMAASGGFGMETEPAGVHGAGVRLATPGGHLSFRGGSNFQPEHGTVRFAVKGDVWKIGEPRWLFDSRGLDRIGVMREPGKLSLVISRGTSIDRFISRLDLPVEQVSTDAWHHILASWDLLSV